MEAPKYPLDDGSQLQAPKVGPPRVVQRDGPMRLTRRGERVLEAVATLGHSTGSDRSLNDYLDRVTRATCDALEYRVCVIYLYDMTDDTFYAEATFGLTVEEQHALLAKPVPRRVLDRLAVERYRLDWSFYVPADAPAWGDSDVVACFGAASPVSSNWQSGWQSGDLFLVPLEISGTEPIGFLIVDEPIDGRFPEPETLLGIATLARSCANALESAQLFKMQSEEAAISSALLQVSEAVGTPDQNLLFERASSSLARLLGANHCAVWHDDEGSATLHIILDALGWADEPGIPSLIWNEEYGLQAALAHGEPLVIDHESNESLVNALGLASALLIPLFFNDALVGAILAGWVGLPHRMRPRELDIARGVSRLMGVAMQNARLYRDTIRQAERNALLYEREREAVQRLQELDQLRNDFVSNVSHELRTPLTGIKGFTETLLSYWDRMDNARRLDMVQRINTSSERLERLVHDLLFVSRVESGILPLHRTITALHPLIETAMKEIEGKYRGQVIEAAPPTSATFVLADADRVQQIVINLLDNAAKYSMEGRPIRIRWSCDDVLASVSVIDNGLGIGKEDFGRLFTRFGKLNRTPRAGHVGTGLGLYISKSLVEAMGGTITVKSRPGLGSIFSFTLPIGADPN